MLNDIKKDIDKLIALYEKERHERLRLEGELKQCMIESNAYKEQIADLERKIDNLHLTEAFMAPVGKNHEATEKIDRMIKEIDKCIKLLS